MMLLAGLFMVFFQEKSLYFITGILGIMLLVMGIRAFIYYFTMAKYMVGGKTALLAAVFLLDLGLFTMTVIDDSQLAILMYLTGWHAFSGLVAVLRAREAKKYKGSWKLTMALGVGSFLIASLCVVFRHRTDLLVTFFCGGLIYGAVIRIITAFRRTEIVFVQ